MATGGKSLESRVASSRGNIDGAVDVPGEGRAGGILAKGEAVERDGRTLRIA